jgi:hypothetical protein
LFDFVEETLDQIAFCVEGKVAGPWMLAIRLGRDDRGDVGRLQILDESIRIIALVTDQRFRAGLGEQGLRLLEIVDLAPGEAQLLRIAQRIGEDMDLGGQSSSRTADGLVFAVFFRAPALC